MLKKSILLVLVSLIMQENIFAYACNAPGCPELKDRQFVSCPNNCTGDNNMELNSVGDKRKLDTSSIQFNNLGLIKESQTVNLDTPTKEKYVGYKVQFNNGEIKDEIQFLGVYETEAENVLYRFFRKIAKDKLWSEVGSLFINEQAKLIKVNVSSDGIISFVGKNGKDAKMYIATKNLTVPRSKK